MDEWSLQLTGEQHLAPSTMRAYQGDAAAVHRVPLRRAVRLGGGVRGGVRAGRHPVAICHEWNTIAHLQDYEGDPEARPFTREELQRSWTTPTTRSTGR